jgi:hypothetical protein
MRVIASLPRTPNQARTIPLERPADSAGVPFDRMIHRAKVPPAALRFCGRARVVEEPSVPRSLFSISIASTARRRGPIR